MNIQISGKKVIVFGGTGFIGSHLVNILCKYSCQVDIVTRSNLKKPDFFLGSEPGQVRIKKIEEFSAENLDRIISNADIVFNLIGILNESRRNFFKNVHTDIPEALAASSLRKGVSNFIHLSALNIENCPDSSYANSKLEGENAIKREFPNCIIVRPSVVFGKRDNFTNLFFNISTFSPILPLIGTPEIRRVNFIPRINFKKKVKFQPIYVGDLAYFLINVCTLKKKSYDLAGPAVQSFDQIFDIILSARGRKRFYLPIPFFVAKVMAFFLELLPKPILTRDQVRLLTRDNISSKGLLNLKQYVKNPSALQTIVETYL